MEQVHKVIIWLTGQPGAGKTTLAKLLLAELPNSISVDGDELRALFPGTGFSKEERIKNIRRAQDLTLFLAAKGITPVVSVVAPYRELREELKSKAKVLEVYVHTNDVRGREKYHVADYEAPLHNFLDLDTGEKTEEECLDEIRTIYRQMATAT